MTDEHEVLEARLRDAADHVAWPTSRDVSATVHRRIEAPPEQPTRPWPRSAVAAVTALAIVVVLLAVPASRRAVADLLGVAGIDLTVTAEPERTGGELDLGAPVSFAAAVNSVDHPVLAPAGDDLGPPSAVYVSDLPPDAIWMVWEANDTLPEVPGSDVGVLFLQFRAELSDGGFLKEIGPSTTVDDVTVGDERGFWIEGAPHGVSYVTADGEEVGELSRLAANVLLWERDRITYRLESSLDREGSLRIAESLKPADP